MEEFMTFTDRPLPFAALVVGLALASGCGRTEMDVLASASDNAGGTTAGQTASESSGAGGGAGGGGIGYAGAGGSDVSSGGASGGASGVCSQAPCLASLFQDCVPEGRCSVEGHSSPSAAFNTACYSNGVTVSTLGTYSGSTSIGSVTVRRNGTPCYEIDTSWETSASAVSYVFRDANGQQVATGTTTVDNTGTVLVTCNGSTATTVSGDCATTGYSSGCDMGTCP
jgi:hypothetical protein